MKRLFPILSMFLISTTALAETCYQVSAFKNAWSKTPEQLCLESKANGEDVTISLRTGLISEEEVARFNLQLLSRARCLDCNKDIYGLSNPSNSSFNTLSISFDGVRDMQTLAEEGTISIGHNRFFYRSF